MKFELQEHIGKYPVVREIGSGATSRVYLARDTFADREVGADDEFTEAFDEILVETRAAQRTER